MSEISNIKVFPVAGQDKIKGNVYFTVGNTVTVKGTIMNGSNGLFVSLPGRSYIDKEGAKKWADDVKFVKEVADSVQGQLIAAYEAQVNGGNVTATKSTAPKQKNADQIPF